MKKSLCFNVACLILGIGLVVAELPINFVWAEVGDCSQASTENYQYCANKEDCATSGCQSGTFTDYPSVTHVVFTEIHETGTCAGSWFSTSECVTCKKYVCAKVTGYTWMDGNQQCQNSVVTIFGTVLNKCI